jgi:glycosyltransferase involved in cell wall biosynthesis
LRIAYACYWDLFTRDGVASKIAGQSAHWRSAGHETSVLALSRTPPPGIEAGIANTTYFFGSPVERIRSTRNLIAAVEEFRPDLVYLRYDLFIPPPTRLLRRFPAVVEINTDDLNEFRSRGRLVTAYNRLQRRGILRHAAGAAFVTHELAASPTFAQVSGRRCVISNGVELPNEVPQPAPANERPRLVFLGAPAYWQGVDKLLRLAAETPEIDVDIAGAASGPPANLPPNVRWHGRLREPEYKVLLARADAGVGTLALHRKGMDEASTLKVRTYLAHGLPVILGHEDTDFLGEDPWFMLRLPNVEDNVLAGAGSIVEFAESVRGRRVPRELVVDRISAEAKERQRLRFFQEVLGDG